MLSAWRLALIQEDSRFGLTRQLKNSRNLLGDRILDPKKVIRYPIMTEVSSRLLEGENKLVFIVNRSTSKQEVTAAVEELYEVKVEKVNTTITNKGQKKAFVKLHPDYKAVDVAIKLGIV
jgi:large subunit ribosomal protein L23